ncbi:PTS transporter subunit EIIB [Ursidibacter sp. B-7004-1]
MDIHKLIDALGSKQNISVVDACLTRLRIALKDKGLVNKTALADLGILDVVDVSNGLQLILGTKAQQYREELNAVLK